MPGCTSSATRIYFRPGAAGAGARWASPTGDIAFLNREEVRLNGALEQVARAAGVGYVDTYAPSAGA